MRIFYKILIYFFALTILPICLMAVVFFSKIDSTIMKESRKALETVTEYKISSIESFLEDCRTDLANLQNSQEVKTKLIILNNYRSDRSSPVFMDTTRSLAYSLKSLLSGHQHLKTIIPYDKLRSNDFWDTHQYLSLVLLDKTGRIVFSDPEDSNHKIGQYSHVLSKDVFENIAINEIFTETLVSSDNVKNVVLFGKDIRDNDNNIIGAIVVHIDVDNIRHIINDVGELGRTSQALIIENKANHSFNYLPPFNRDSGRIITSNLMVKGKIYEELKSAESRKMRVIIAKDYKGRKVLACLGHIPKTNWGIIIKADLGEIRAPINSLQYFIFYIVIMILIVVVIFGYILAKLVSKPIITLCEGAKKLREGDLQYVVATDSPDEIGQLSRIVDETRVKLLGLYNDMEEEIRSKTADLSKALTETKVKNNQLTAISDELLRSNLELDDFAYIASHDLKEPLRSISNFATFLLEDNKDQLDEDGIRKLNVLINQSARLSSFLTALLEYSRAGRDRVAKVNVNINKVLEIVKQDLDYLVHSDPSVTVQIVSETALPIVKTDPEFIKEILMNLVVNGIKYNSGKEKVVAIGFLAEYATLQNVFYVKDNGIGIEERHFEEIFKIFRRIHGRDKYGGGTGAGLTIVKKKIEAMGGKIWLESGYGVGTVFYFTIGGNEYETK